MSKGLTTPVAKLSQCCLKKSKRSFPGLSRTRRGEIHMIIGPMFSGKSTALIQRVKEDEAAGLQAQMVNSSRDVRYSSFEVVSHGGATRPCHCIEKLWDIPILLGFEHFSRVDVLAIDEAQFFPDLASFCISAAEDHHKKVIVAGLSGDFRRKRFGQISDLIPIADSVLKLTSNCAMCDMTSGLFSLRTTSNWENQELIGGPDSYKPVCRSCYTSAWAEQTT